VAGIAYVADRGWVVDAVRRRQAELTTDPWYRWPMGPPVEAVQVAVYEARLGIELPGDYKDFLLAVGDGGGGPNCYMRRFGQFPLDGLSEQEVAVLVDDSDRNPDLSAARAWRRAMGSPTIASRIGPAPTPTIGP